MKQQADASYVLEFHKDEKRMESKGAIFLDSAVDVRKVCQCGVALLCSVCLLCYQQMIFGLKGALKTLLGSPLCSEIHHYLAFQALPFTSAFYSLSTCAVCPQRHTSSSVMPILLADWLHCQ